jgi:hypothetical protein
MPDLNLSFPHTWTAEVLERRPLILPRRQFVYPQHVDEVERGALEVLIQPASGEAFLATCALGFADPLVPTGVWSCPDPDWLCAVAGGYAYLMDTAQPERWLQIAYRPVLEVRAVLDPQLLLFVSHHSILAWGKEGQLWQSPRLSSEGVTIQSIDASTIHGTGWDLMTDKEFPFTLDLKTGERRPE